MSGSNQTGYVNYGSGRKAAMRNVSSAPYYGNPISFGTDGPGPDGVDERHHRNELSKFFGLPTGATINTKPGDELPREDRALPEGYAGPNMHMTNVIIDMIKQEELWPVTELFPWIKNAGSISYEWIEFKFHSHTLSRTPEEAASRMVTNSQSSRQASLSRYGIAFMIEHGFYDTPHGAAVYKGQLTQMRNAVIYHMCTGAMLSLLDADPTAEALWQQARNPHPNRSQMQDLLKFEVAQVGYINKNPWGFEKKVREMQNAMRARSQEAGNMLVLPGGAEAFIKGRPEHTYFLVSGQRSTDISREKLRADGQVVIRTSIAYPTGEKLPSMDTMFRDRCVGSHQAMIADNLKGMPPEKYRTEHNDIYMFNYNSDAFERVEYRKAIQCAGIITEDGEFNHDVGAKYFAMYGGSNVARFLKEMKVFEPTVARINSMSPSEKTQFMEMLAGKNLGGWDDAINPNRPEDAHAYPGVAKGGVRGDHDAEMKDYDNKAGSKRRQVDLERKQNVDQPVAELKRSRLAFEALYKEAAEKKQDVRGLAQQEREAVISAMDSVKSGLYARGVEDEIGPFNAEAIRTGDVDDYGTRHFNGKSGAFDPERAKHVKDQYVARINTVLNALQAVRVPEVEVISGGMHIDAHPDAVRLVSEVESSGQSWQDNVAHDMQLSASARSSITQAIGNATDILREEAAKLRLDDADFSSVNAAYHMQRAAARAANIVITAAERADGAGTRMPRDEKVKDDVYLPLVIGFSSNPSTTRTYVSETSRPIPLQVLYDILPASSVMLLALHGRGDSAPSKHRLAQLDEMSEKVQIIAGSVHHHAGFRASLLLSVIFYHATNMKFFYSNPREADLDGLRSASALLCGEQVGVPTVTPVQLHVADRIASLTSIPVKICKEHLDLRQAAIEWMEAVDPLGDWGFSSSTLPHINMSSEPVIAGSFLLADRKASYTKAFSYSPRDQKHAKVYTEAIDALFRWIMSSGTAGSAARAVLYPTLRATQNILEGGASRHPSPAQQVSIEGLRAVLRARYAGDSEGALEHRAVIAKADAAEDHELHTKKEVNAELQNLFDDLKELVKTKETEHITRRVLKRKGIDAAYVAGPLEAGYKRPRRGEDFADPMLDDDAAKDSFKDDFKQKYNAIKNADAAAGTNFSSEDIHKYLSALDFSDRGVLRFFLDHNLPCGVGILLSRPFIMIHAGDMVLCKAGGETGQTIYHRPNFELSDDATLKIHYGHFTIYCKTLIWKPQNIIIARAVYWDKYIGGGGLDMYDVNSPDDIAMYTNSSMQKDMFCFAIPYTWKMRWNMDVCGKDHPAYADDVDGAHYDTWSIYANIWEFKHKKEIDPFKKHFGQNATDPAGATITIQDAALTFDHSTGKHSAFVQNRGHMGNLYDGFVHDMETGTPPRHYAPPHTSTIALSM